MNYANRLYGMFLARKNNAKAFQNSVDNLSTTGTHKRLTTMRHVKLIVRKDEVTGENGLVVKGLPCLEDEAMATTEGRLIAHDLLEHVNGIKYIGSIGDELEALGAAWFIRGQNGDIIRGYYTSNRSSEEIIAGDVANLAVKYVQSFEGFGKDPKNTKKLDDDDIEESFKEIILKAKDSAISELECYFDSEEEEEEKTQFLEEFLKHALGFMRTGYRKAVRKYNDDSGSANYLFWNITEAINNVLKRVLELYEGQEFILKYDSKMVNYCHAEFHECEGTYY